jgi:hypothetical protein
MTKKNALNVTFKVEEVANGFVVMVGHSIEMGGFADRYVFTSTDDLTEFMTDYIGDRV